MSGEEVSTMALSPWMACGAVGGGLSGENFGNVFTPAREEKRKTPPKASRFSCHKGNWGLTALVAEAF